MSYRNSVYGTLAEERYRVAADGRFALVELAADQLAVLEEYYAVPGPVRRAPYRTAGTSSRRPARRRRVRRARRSRDRPRRAHPARARPRAGAAGTAGSGRRPDCRPRRRGGPMTSRDEPPTGPSAPTCRRAGRAVTSSRSTRRRILAEYEAEKPARHLSGVPLRVVQGLGVLLSLYALWWVFNPMPAAALPAVVPEGRARPDVPGLPRLGASAAARSAGAPDNPNVARLAAGRRGGRPVRLYRLGLETRSSGAPSCRPSSTSSWARSRSC